MLGFRSSTAWIPAAIRRPSALLFLRSIANSATPCRAEIRPLVTFINRSTTDAAPRKEGMKLPHFRAMIELGEIAWPPTPQIRS